METKKLSSMIMAAIDDGIELKRDGKVILLKFATRTATPCSNPNFNCSIAEDADVAIIASTLKGDERMGFPGCEIEGDAIVSRDSTIVFNGISVKRGLSVINS